MHTVKLDLKHGSASIDSTSIKVDGNGIVVNSIAKLCSRPIHTSHGNTRYHLLRKISVYGKPGDGVIEVEEGRIFSLTLLFDFIDFFASSILESKVVKACEKSSNLKFTSNHPSTAFLEPCEWGNAMFFYDAKQGELGLEIRFEHRSTE